MNTVDGRARRASHSQQAIRDAVFELVAASGTMPSAAQVAERAGVGERTVFRHFDDLEGLFLGVHERLAEHVLSLVVIEPPCGDLEVDLAGVLARRARIYEALAPFRRAARRFIDTSAVVRDTLVATDEQLRALWQLALHQHVAPQHVHAVDLLLSYEAWDRLRHAQHLSVDEATETLREALRQLLR